MVGLNLLPLSLPILVLLSFVETSGPRDCCWDPKGTCGEKITHGGIKYICTKKKGWKPYDCPKIIEVEDNWYRLFDKRPTTCVGNINQCVYLSRWQEFCMNGDFPFVTPQRLPIEPYQEDFSESYQNTTAVTTYVTTYLGPKRTGPDFFNMSTTGQPVDKYTFYESHVSGEVYRTCAGFIWVNYKLVEQTPIGNVNVDILSSVEVEVGLTDFITGVVGRSGALINNLQFEVQSGRKIQSCGGIYGTRQDVTPNPRKHGRCYMINIAGTTPYFNANFLATMQFDWACQK